MASPDSKSSTPEPEPSIPLHHAIQGLRVDIQDLKKGHSARLQVLEEKAMYIPNAKEAELIKEAAGYYRSKREFRERLLERFIEKGVLGLVVFLSAAAFYYVKHLLTAGT